MDIREFMDFLVANFSSLAPEEMRRFDPIATAAWTELGPKFDAARAGINGLTRQALEEHGLIGDQLEFKVVPLETELGKVDWKTRVQNYFEPRVKALRERLPCLSNGIDNLLGSIAKVVPPVGAISEVKHHLTWCLDRKGQGRETQ